MTFSLQEFFQTSFNIFYKKLRIQTKFPVNLPYFRLLSILIPGNTQIKVLDDDEIEAMRVVGKLARECLDEGAKVCGVGVPTDEIDRAVHEGMEGC